MIIVISFLGGVVDGKFLSRNEMVEYSKMPSIDIVRAQLCQTLEMCGSNLVNNMNQHQSNLVYNLDNYVKINSEPPPATESTDNENT